MSRGCPWLGCLALVLLAARAPADDTVARTVLPGESPSAAQRLETARKLARDRQYAEAVDEYQRLLEEAGDKLAPLGEQHLVQVRWLCHLDLAALPAEALRLYRNRVDAQARKWFEQGAANRDVALLRRVVDEAFCSRYGEQALDLLGDLAFERGRFVEAERWWLRLTPPGRDAGAAVPLDLFFPDARVDPARARAKQLLARLFLPESEVSRADLGTALRAYGGQHADATGPLAGRTGKYADTLQELLEQRTGLLPEAPAWSSFGGGPARSLVLPRERSDPNRLTRLVRRWRVNLQTGTPLQDDDPLPGRAPSTAAARSLAFHPLVADGQVLVADGRKVTAYDLRTGRGSDWYDAGPGNGAARLPAAPDLRYTLTVADACVFTRLGVQGIDPGRQGNGDSAVVCLSLKPDARGKRLRWLARPEGDNRARPVFEGTPVAGDGRVYVAASRLAGGRTVTAVSCYPVHAEGTPPLRWRQDVCETTESNGKEQVRYRHHLLTLAGSNVVYCSHSGAVVALDAVTGRHAWARRYPSRGLVRDDKPSPRDLTPPVYAAGRLFVAPADDDRLLCLDPATGQLLWQRDGIEVVQLLGVGRGRLVFTTPQGIRAVSAATGDDRDGWAQPDVGELPPFGRGFLAGDLVFWPTRHKLYVLDQADGRQPDDLYPGPWQDIPPGNLVYGDGCLVVAGEEALSAYVPPSWLRAEREGEVRQQPRSAAAHYQLAVAAADDGHENLALAELNRAETLAAPGECWQGEALRALTQRVRQAVLLGRADRAAAERRWEEAAAALRQAADKGPVGERLEALRQEAGVWERAGQPARATAVWQDVLRDPVLRAGRLADAQGNRQDAGLFAARRLEEPAGGTRPDSRAPRNERTAPPDLELPLLRAWHVPLTGEEALLPLHGAEGGAVLFARGRTLVRRDPTTGRETGSNILPFVPVWAGGCADRLIVAGPGGVAALPRDGGAGLWSFPASTGGPLSDFQLTATRLFCLQGGRLVALDPETGWVEWSAAAPSAELHLPDPSGRFLAWRAGVDRVVAQTAGGKLWVLDGRTGKRRHELPTGRAPWPRAPVFLDPERVGLVTDPRTVVLLDVAGGKELARPPLTAPTTLSGRPPFLVGGPGALLLVVDRNFGPTLRRLDPNTGKALWPEERLLGADPVAEDGVALDGEAVYGASGDALSAHALANGELLWRFSLPGGRHPWRLLLARSDVIAWPADVGLRRLRYGGCAGGFGLTVDFAARECRALGVPLLFIDRRTGRLVQCLHLHAPSPGLVVEGPSPGERPWLPQLRLEEPALAVQVSAHGVVATFPGRAWGRSATEP
jgi:outer membrane protein assembly factor BamB